MRRWLAAAAVLGLLAGCNLFGGSGPSDGFAGWFHVDRPGRATSVAFATDYYAEVRDLGCDGVLNGDTPWTQDGDAIVLAQWAPPPPRFTVDPSTQGALVASPGMYDAGSEQWLPGATCLVCPAGDAGVAVACSEPAVQDAGT